VFSMSFAVLTGEGTAEEAKGRKSYNSHKAVP